MATSYDTAFEPHDAYMFEDSTTAEQQLRNTAGGLYTSNDIFARHCTDTAMSVQDYCMGMSSNDTHTGQDLQLPWAHDILQGDPYDRSNGQLSPTTAWQSPGSFEMTQPPRVSDMQNRDGGVAQFYGMVTPRDSQSHSPTGMDDLKQQQNCEQAAQSNAKSERARNAANKRHSNAKQAKETLHKRIESSAKCEPAENGQEPEQDGHRGADRQEYREKNRLAAAKCRKKKKDTTGILEQKAKSVTTENSDLKAMLRQLRDEYSELRTRALAHDSCRCVDIHMYNASQAQQAARGHAGNPVSMAQSVQGLQGALHSPCESDKGAPEAFARSSSHGHSFLQPEHTRSDSMMPQLDAYDLDNFREDDAGGRFQDFI